MMKLESFKEVADAATSHTWSAVRPPFADRACHSKRRAGLTCHATTLGALYPVRSLLLSPTAAISQLTLRPPPCETSPGRVCGPAIGREEKHATRPGRSCELRSTLAHLPSRFSNRATATTGLHRPRQPNQVDSPDIPAS